MAAPRMVCLVALLAIAGPSMAAAVTPVQKVIALMQDMLVKADAAKKDEAVKFSAFYQWCGDQTKIREDEIEEATEKIGMLKAEIEKAAVHIQQLTDRIDELGEDVGRWKVDEKSATEVRDKEREDYQGTLTDYTESLTAMDGAIAVLKKQDFARSQAEALLQVSRLRLVPSPARRALQAFLQGKQPSTEATDAAMPDDHLSLRNPEAAGYSFQSGGVIEMLEKLRDEFDTKKRELMTEELNTKHGYEQIMQTLADNIENAEHEVSKKTTLRSQVQQQKAEFEGELAQTIADRAEDQKYLDDMTALCAQKKRDFDSRQELRAGEIEAIKKAVEIMSSGAVSSAADKHLPTLVQLRKVQALAQLRSNEYSPLQWHLAAFLAERARATGSKLLAMVSERAAADPFTKVKKMIKDLMVKLMEEATAEIEHKGWCDTELGTNQQSRESLTEDVNSLTTEIEDLTATIAQLTQDIEDLSTAVAELDKNMASATEERQASKEKNAATVSDAKQAQTAVQQATAVLKEFFEKAGEATALAQGPADDAPETFDKAYKGLQAEGGSVIDFLEVILTDFARLESETTTAEATEQDQYDKFTFESRKDKALKENESKHKSEKRTSKESSLQAAKEELASTQDSLDKAVAYYEKLKPKCIDSGITYEERVKRREEEIQSLQEALKILQGEDIPASLDRSGDTN